MHEPAVLAPTPAQPSINVTANRCDTFVIYKLMWEPTALALALGYTSM